MMYRCGWATKENQERVLAIWINKNDFEKILSQAVFSSFDKQYYESNDEWKKELGTKEARLQWDPDHDPHGHKLERRTIQLGMKGNLLEAFGKQYIKHIADITGFVTEQKQSLDANMIEKLLVPVETVFEPSDKNLKKRIGID